MASDYDRIREENIREYGEGTRHLSFLGELYTDRTHFVFELLQNAEDAGASRIKFRLLRGALEVAHDGKEFAEADVRGICGVVAGTKSDDLTKIGRFGVGFKSVYAFTNSPEVHSGVESFKIEHFVRPFAAARRDAPEGLQTLFLFPFDRKEVDSGVAFEEIGDRLMNLGAETLLFLRSLERIEWETEQGLSGTYSRREEPCGTAREVRVSAVDPEGGEDVQDWLVFERKVEGFSESGADSSDLRPVEIAYALDYDEEGDSNLIVQLEGSPLVAFFPTEKETNCSFLIQGPYRTTPARDNVPQHDEWNRYLVEETALLVVESLHSLKREGRLTVDVLGTMPLRPRDFPEDGMFRPIFDLVSEALWDEDLIPTENGDFVRGSQAKLGRGSEIRALLGPDQLIEQYGEDDDPIEWVTREISSESEDTVDLHRFLRSQVGIEEISPESFVRGIDDDFLERQSDTWMEAFYSFLGGQSSLWQGLRNGRGPLRGKRFVRLEDGTMQHPFSSDGSLSVFLPTKEIRGVNSVRQACLGGDAESFLRALGVREADLVTVVFDQVVPYYESNETEDDPEQHDRHIALIERAMRSASEESREDLKSRLEGLPFLPATNDTTGDSCWAAPQDVYMRTRELVAYFAGNEEVWFVEDRYSASQLELLMELGAADSVRVIVREPDEDGAVVVSARRGDYKRGLDGFDPSATADGLDHVVSEPTVEGACVVWNQIVRPYRSCIAGMVEVATRRTYEGSERRWLHSRMGKLLCDHPWMPALEGGFRRPGELSLEQLPEGFERDEEAALALDMKLSEMAALARRAGVDPEDLELARKIGSDPERRKQILELLEASEKKPDFPERLSKNPERRKSKSGERAKEAPEKKYEKKSRSVRTSVPDQDTKEYLRTQYTNADGQLVCQMCQNEMPFLKRDGQHYFEAVALFDSLRVEYAAAFGAFCPLCAAKYKELFRRDKPSASSLMSEVISKENLEFDLDLGVEVAKLCFVETHLIDLRALLEEEKASA